MTKKPKPSELMDRLYGKEAGPVYDKLQKLDPQINSMIQEFVYDEVWNYPPLSLKEKSLVTVAALVAQSRPDQLRIHMNGFLSCGGTREELRGAIQHLAVYCGFPAALSAFAILNELEQANEK
jgi:4-carboxymuconolactone decarboxylase